MVQFFGKKVGIALSFLVIVIIAAVALNRTSPDVEITGGTTIETKTLATCLQERGAKIYGSLNCASCREQKQLFAEEEIKNLYIECGYLGNFVKKCQDLSITEELTWLINGQRYPGLKTEAELRTLANC